MNLYNKYRPPDLSSVLGNKETVTYLGHVDYDNFPSAILFYGPTGCGKTTLARIVTGELGSDVNEIIEINSATFRGIDTVREINRNARFTTLSGGPKVYLIDEVHQMTKDAQNGLLKILEEPPPDVYFLLCTTDPSKLLKTVRNRCIELVVGPLEEDECVELLSQIATEEGHKVKDDILEQIAEVSDGIPRLAVQILDKVLTLPAKQMRSGVLAYQLEEQESIELCRALIQGKGWKAVSTILKGLKTTDPEGIRRHVLGYCQSVLLNKPDDNVALIMEEFIEPFYNSGYSGLVFACYSILKG